MNVIARNWRNFLIWMTPVEDMEESIYKEAMNTLAYLQMTYSDEQVTEIINQLTMLVRSEKISTIDILLQELNRKRADLKEFNNLIPETDET